MPRSGIYLVFNVITFLKAGVAFYIFVRVWNSLFTNIKVPGTIL